MPAQKPLPARDIAKLKRIVRCMGDIYASESETLQVIESITDELTQTTPFSQSTRALALQNQSLKRLISKTFSSPLARRIHTLGIGVIGNILLPIYSVKEFIGVIRFPTEQKMIAHHYKQQAKKASGKEEKEKLTVFANYFERAHKNPTKFYNELVDITEQLKRDSRRIMPTGMLQEAFRIQQNKINQSFNFFQQLKAEVDKRPQDFGLSKDFTDFMTAKGMTIPPKKNPCTHIINDLLSFLFIHKETDFEKAARIEGRRKPISKENNK